MRQAQRKEGAYAHAGQHYARALRCNPCSANAHHNTASICQRLNRFEEAIPHYEAAVRRSLNHTKEEHKQLTHEDHKDIHLRYSYFTVAEVPILL